MVHFDQPAILGILLTVFGIMDFESTGKKKYLLAGTLIGPLLGRGYAVIFFLAAWYMYRLIRNYKNKVDFWRSIFSAPLLFLLLSVPLLSLVSNVLNEARIRNVSWKETGIVVSARHRLGIDTYKTVNQQESRFRWPSYVNNQVQRLLDLCTPHPIWAIHVKNYKAPVTHYLTLLPKLLFQLLMLFLLFKNFRGFWSRLPESSRNSFIMMGGGGVLWILVMRNLAYFHEYVTLYLFGFLILISYFLIDLMKTRGMNFTLVTRVLVIAALIVNFAKGSWVGSQVNWQSTEFQRMQDELILEGVKTVYIAPMKKNYFVDGVAYGESFFFREFAVGTTPEVSDREIMKVIDDGHTRLMAVKIGEGK